MFEIFVASIGKLQEDVYKDVESYEERLKSMTLGRHTGPNCFHLEMTAN